MPSLFQSSLPTRRRTIFRLNLPSVPYSSRLFSWGRLALVFLSRPHLLSEPWVAYDFPSSAMEASVTSDRVPSFPFLETFFPRPFGLQTPTFLSSPSLSRWNPHASVMSTSEVHECPFPAWSPSMGSSVAKGGTSAISAECHSPLLTATSAPAVSFKRSPSLQPGNSQRESTGLQQGLDNSPSLETEGPASGKLCPHIVCLLNGVFFSNNKIRI